MNYNYTPVLQNSMVKNASEMCQHYRMRYMQYSIEDALITLINIHEFCLIRIIHNRILLFEKRPVVGRAVGRKGGRDDADR